ncbi:MAG TPA: uroporphyrinogen-III C-methyltransferase [Ktedonobacteraceae bacterium]|nr:uroporphyrinogen-III C-methyltransferase [Ktedonobacteraceae bacterium]
MAREDVLYGKVYLVGAGPGDPDLITRKGLRCLHNADVLIYDRLVSRELLDEAPYRAERIFVGKKPGCHAITQEQISALLIHYARLGCCVVRLKGGDPFVFGRGGEEALALSEAGIPFEIVPGVSSAIAVPAYVGIPVTQRDYAGAVTIVTGHEQHVSASAAVNWDALAKTGGTLVILMGVELLSSVTQRLLDGGLAPDTEAAVIQQGTLPQQRVVRGTLSTIAQRATEARISSPAITVIGAVVGLSDALAWFETLPLESAEKPVILSSNFAESKKVFHRKVSEVIK